MANYSNEITNAVLSINAELGNDSKLLHNLKWLCKTRRGDVFTSRMSEECTSFLELFEKLNDLCIISPDNVTFLSKILEDVGKLNLKAMIDGASQDNHRNRNERQLPNGSRQVHETQHRRVEPVSPQVVMAPREELLGEDLMPHFEVLVQYIGRDWRYLGRQLGLQEFDFENIMEQYPRNLREQVMKMLSTWKERYRVKATKAVLVKALRKCRMNLAADILEKMSVTSG